MPIPVQQFQVAPSGAAAALSKMLQGGMAGYQQSQQMKQAKQQMQMQQAQQKAMEDKMRQQNTLQQQFAQLMGNAGTPGKPSQGVPYRDMPGTPGTGYLGGQMPDNQMKAQLAKILGASGDYDKAASLLYPKEGSKFALQSTLDEMGYSEGTKERQDAARALATGKLLPQRVKAGRYASGTAAGLIKDVDENNVMDAVAGYSGATGMAKEGFESLASPLGFGSKDYTKYKTFVNTTVPAIVAEIRTTLGDNVSDETNKILSKMVNSSSWTGSKEQVKSNWDQLKKVHEIASKSIRRNPLEVQRSLYEEYGDSGQQAVVPRGTTNGGHPGAIAELKKRGLL